MIMLFFITTAINIKHVPVKGGNISQNMIITDIATIYKDTQNIEYHNNRDSYDHYELGFYRYEIRYLKDLDIFLVKNICKNINHKYFNFLEVTKNITSVNYNFLAYFTDYLARPELQDYQLMFIHDSKKYNTIESYVKFILNGIEAKSIKKLFYKKLESSFNFNAYFVLCRVFKDVNFIYSILNSYQNTRFFCQVENSIKFIKYLQKYYTDSQISNIITCNDNIQIIIDIFHLIDHIYNTQIKFFYNNFQKVKATTKHIHNELSRISHLLEDNSLKLKFNYSVSEQKREIKVEYLKFKLPKNGLELTQWATILNNCMAGYISSIKYKETIIYGVFDKDNLQFAVEINEDKLIQASGKDNKNIDEEDMYIINKWFNLDE